MGPGLRFLRSFSGFHRLVLVTDSMYGLQIIQGNLFPFKEIANLDNILIERAAANVGVNSPNRVNQILPSDDRAGVVVKVG